MKRFSRFLLNLALTWTVLFFCVLTFSPKPHFLVLAHPQVTQPSLGTAGNFAVLGASTVTNTGSTVVTGDLGVSPGTAVTGFPPGNVTGTIHAADAVAQQAHDDAAVAYDDAAGQTCDGNLTGQDLGDKTLTPGVYCFSSSAQLTGQIQLDSQENPAGVFIFQIGSTLTTASNATVVLIHGTQACNVFWQVGSSATLGTNTDFAGNILALTSITATTGTTANGSLSAHTGAVTLDTNTITHSSCSSPTPTLTPSATATPAPAFLITKTHSGGNITFVGQSITYNLVIMNLPSAGPETTSNSIIVTDVIPLGLGKITASGFNWTIALTAAVSPATLTATYSGTYPIAAGTVLPPIALSGTLTDAAVPTFTNTASVVASAALSSPLTTAVDTVSDLVPTPTPIQTVIVKLTIHIVITP